MNKEQEDLIIAFIDIANKELDTIHLLMKEMKHRLDILWMMKGPTIL